MAEVPGQQEELIQSIEVVNSQACLKNEMEGLDNAQGQKAVKSC